MKNYLNIKGGLNKALQHQYFAKAIQWSKLIGFTGGMEVAVQGLGFLSGILVIRLLPVEEYALYTLANTLLGTMTILADGGISSGVMAEGGKNWQDKEKLGAILATGLDLRRKFAIGSLLISLPLLVILLLRHDASVLTAVLIALSIIPAFYAALSDSLLEIVPKLHQDIKPLQKNQLLVGSGRLLFTALFIFIFPFTFIAILASGFPRMYGNVRLRSIANKFIDDDRQPDPEIRKRILSVVKRILPGAIYYCISGQLTIWLISIFGNTSSLAQIGALERFITALSFIGVLSSMLVVPRFARLSEDTGKLSSRSVQIIVGVFVLMIAVTSFFHFFSDFILLILGDGYTNLNFELTLCIAGGSLNIISGIVYSLCTSRGWVINPIISISVSVVSVVIGIFMFEVSSLIGVLFYNIFLAAIQVALNASYLSYRLVKLNPA